MNNCLVTKLKSTVNNEDLSKLNVLTIKTKAIDSPSIHSQYLAIGASKNGSISINSQSVGLYKTGISGELYPYPCTVPALSSLESRFENKDGIIEVTGKYNLSGISVGASGTLRMKEIYGIPGTLKSFFLLGNIEEGEIDATKFRNALNVGVFSSLELPEKNGNEAIDIINVLSKNTVGEFKAITKINTSFCALFDGIGLDDLINNVSLTSISFIKLNAGNLSSLAKLTNLATIGFIDNKQNSGDIMDFINPWIQAGRTSGKINVKYLLNQKNVTLNGQPITYPEGVDNISAYLNWTSDGTVTFTAS